MSATDLDRIADEYVVGLMDDDEAREIERRMAGEPALAAAISAAAERFLEIDLSETPVALAAEGWSGVEARLRAAEGAGGDPILLAAERLRRRPTVASHWRTVAQAGMAACLVLAAALGWQLSQPAPEMIAVLVDSAGEPQAVIEAFADDRVTVLPLVDFAVPDGSTLQVWTLPAVADAKPVSLGLIDHIARLNLRGPDLPAPAQGQLYEITIEQAGGSPTGLPTGPIVGKGFAKGII
ncbi:anti-sigma-K factor RskA [Hoeflea marina]|uniref:Anti-sigma-K factor RskA n=1 Tax=Hoeflea marina TaxID=274592 RepID=A0A317PD02_9HYPH|nr:anti-sigma factor [Hoeflea marina]PWV97515.1 anti-sigma-K factor RskA [Hoeflea marina]